MRLTAEQCQAIERLAHEWLGECVRVQVFGSRLNDAACGGDVDLLVQADHPVSVAQKAELGWRLEQALDLPVDLVVIDPEGPRTAFQHLALTNVQDLMPAAGF